MYFSGCLMACAALSPLVFAQPAVAGDCSSLQSNYIANPTLEAAKEYISCLEKPVELASMIPTATLPSCAIDQPLQPIVIGSPVPNNAQGYVIEATNSLERFKAENRISDALWVNMMSSSLSKQDSALVLMNKDVVDPNLKLLKDFKINGNIAAVDVNPQIWLSDRNFNNAVRGLSVKQ